MGMGKSNYNICVRIFSWEDFWIMDKKTTVIIILSLVILGSITYGVYTYGVINSFEQGRQQGVFDVVSAIVQTAQTCQVIPLDFNNLSAQLRDVRCVE